MSNIIDFKNYNWRKNKMARYEELIRKLQKKKQENHEYSLDEVKNTARDILSNTEGYRGKGATPIVKIADEFGFKTYEHPLANNLSGDIYINGDTFKKYGHDRVILVNETEPLYHQRFVIAHELAHYLFDYIGNAKYTDIQFSDTYFKDRHETPQEIRANYFAAEILMPKDLFIKQYNIARNASTNRLFVVTYLSRFFETSINSIEKRIVEVIG